MKIRCDKCGSLRVEQFLKEPPKEPEPVSMKAIAEGTAYPSYEHAVYVTKHWVLLCKDCGYRLEYSR